LKEQRGSPEAGCRALTQQRNVSGTLRQAASAQVFRGAKEDERGLELQVCRRGVWASAGQRSAAASLDRAHLQRPSRHCPGDSLLLEDISVIYTDIICISEFVLIAWESI